MADEQVVSCGRGIWSCTSSYEIRFIVLSNQSERRISALIEIKDGSWGSFICELDGYTTCNSLGMSLKSSPSVTVAS